MNSAATGLLLLLLCVGVACVCLCPSVCLSVCVHACVPTCVWVGVCACDHYVHELVILHTGVHGNIECT